jgi:hypothetical protein
MLKKIIIGLAVVVVAFAGFVSTRPDTYSVQRTATIQAAPEFAFAMVNDFHRWNEWSPWDKLDPKMERTFDGAAAGAGAKYEWKGNDQVGKGRMTIEQSKQNELVHIKLEFIEPWESTNATIFEFKPTGEGTTVTWRMEGTNNFMGKAFSVFMDMDGMIGKDFENGLAAMKTGAEADAKKHAEEKAAAEKLAAEKAAAEKAAAEAAAAAAAPPAEGATAASPTP